MKDSEFLFDLANRCFPKRNIDGKLNSRHRKLRQIAKAIKKLEDTFGFKKLHEANLSQTLTNRDLSPDHVQS